MSSPKSPWKEVGLSSARVMGKTKKPKELKIVLPGARDSRRMGVTKGLKDCGFRGCQRKIPKNALICVGCEARRWRQRKMMAEAGR